MELRTYLHEVWRHLLIIILAVVVAALVAFVVSNATEKVYTAEARIVVTAGLGKDATSVDKVLAAPSVGQTYAVLATTRPVLLDVIKRADLPYDPAELMLRLSVTAGPDTPFLVISANDANPVAAAAAANALADVLVEMASTPPTNVAAGQDLLAIVERATVPDSPSGPRVLFNTILAAVAVLILGLLIVSLGTYLRDDGPAKQTANG